MESSQPPIPEYPKGTLSEMLNIINSHAPKSGEDLAEEREEIIYYIKEFLGCDARRDRKNEMFFLTELIDIDPDCKTPYNGFCYNHYYNRGVLYGYLQEWDKAIADYTKAIEVNPHHDLAWGNRGMAYYALKDMVSAYRDVTAALKANPKSIHQLNLQHFNGEGVFGITTCPENTPGVDIPNFTYQR